VIKVLPCDLCGSENPKFLLTSPGLDGPLVECRNCGFRYVGERRSGLTFGAEATDVTAHRIRQANSRFSGMPAGEEQRLAMLDARWRLDLIRRFRPSGKLLEAGCARGEFLRAARESFEVYGVEPNPGLAQSASEVAPVHCGLIENSPWSDFDVAASFHVIEHVDSPRRFIAAMAQRLKPGGLVVIETPDIQSLPFRLLRKRWRQFIPEHYYFFDPATLARMLGASGLRVERTIRVGKYASFNLILNRLSRYVPALKGAGTASRLTFRINPLDIMLVVATSPDGGRR
jgi:2-polyprenyl-3-methyl-5-hydroxy-6-metoxy-1,4-benzoquinol methylase